MADVARGHQPSDLLLRAAARVALELDRVADEDPPGLAGRQLVAVGVEDLDDGAADDASDGAGLRAQVGGASAIVAYATSVEPYRL